MNRILLFAILTILLACKHEHEEQTHEADGLGTIAHTLYSDKTEIFVEFKPLVVGTPSKFAAHFTVLGESFLPLTEGTVTVTLNVGGTGKNQTASEPSSPGIYRLSLQPNVAGKGQLVFDIVTKEFTDKQVIDVIVYADEKSAIEDQKPESIDANEVSFLKEQAWKIEFANTAVKKQPFSQVIKTNGEILSAPGDEMVVSASAGGVIRFSENSLPGNEVRDGERLFTIVGGNLTGGNVDTRYKEISATYQNAKSEYDRANELVKDRIISEKDFLQAKLRFESAEIQYNRIVKNYSPGGLTIVSPLRGFVKNILVTDGQFVTEGMPVATVSKNKKLILKAIVSQRYFNSLAGIETANFKTANSTTVYSVDQLGGKLLSFGKSASANSPFIPVTFEINNVGDLIPGSVAEVFLKSTATKDALIIPIKALIEEQGNFFVYIQTAGESFQKRPVTTGPDDGQMIQIVSGIKEGERVVTKGGLGIKLAAAGGMPEHGHEH